MTVLESKRINNFFKKELIVLSFYKKTKQDLTFCTFLYKWRRIRKGG